MGNPIGYNTQSSSLLMQAPNKLAGTTVTGPTMTTYVANSLGQATILALDVGFLTGIGWTPVTSSMAMSPPGFVPFSSFTGPSGTKYTSGQSGAIPISSVDVGYALSLGWTMANQPYILAQWAVPSGVAPTGSVAANGALTLGTALATTYSGGIWLALPAGAAYAGSAAGSYWCVMTSTTLGTIYNNVLGATVPFIPVNPAPIVAAGPGAYTGVTTTQTCASVIVPGGAMGPNGTIRVTASASYSNTANNKTVRVYLGTITTNSLVVFNGASLAANKFMGLCTNRGSQQSQVMVSGGAILGLNEATVFSSVDTSQASTITQSQQLATATDFSILESFTLEILPG